MKEKDFNPRVRYFNKVSTKVEYNGLVKAYDYRLFYVISGKIEIVFKESEESLERASAIIIPPGIPYKVEAVGNFSYYVVNFDFTSENSGFGAKAPDEAKNFVKEEIFSKDCIPHFEKVNIIKDAECVESYLGEMYAYKDSLHLEAGWIKSGILKYILTKLKILMEKDGIDRDTKILAAKIKETVIKEWNKGINNEKVGKLLGYHPYYLNSVFLKAEGITLHKYIEDVKIKRMGEALLMKDKSIKEVAEECGFPDASSFSAFFRKKEGVTPKEYRKSAYRGCL